MGEFKSIYFVGAGGIGMAALVRYYLSKGYKVAGYDRTKTTLTEQIAAEGAEISYNEAVSEIPEYCKDKATTLVVYT
ncbi:MAG: Mur ligase domain-containing protein, partial [Muribaculaceae bacterium]